MIIVMKAGATEAEISQMSDHIRELGFTPDVSKGTQQTVIGILEDVTPIRELPWEAMPGVEKVIHIRRPYKLTSREYHPEDSHIQVRNLTFGAKKVVLGAGPCAVEDREQIIQTARAVKQYGASLLRGGAFKPRTSPRSFQGLGEKGLLMLAEAGQEVGLATITEVMSPDQVELVAKYADILQIGARNMQNFSLLQATGASGKTVLLKRGLSATIEEWLLAAEYILMKGNRNVILCERGIRTFETQTRNTLDLSSVAVVKRLSHLPVVVDPSHGTGRRELVLAMSKAAIAVGADGLLIEVHPVPEKALVDGDQSLNFAEFEELSNAVKHVAAAIGREL